MDCVHNDCVTKPSEVVDIVIVSSRASDAAALWVNYLTTCFHQVAKERSRPPFKLVCIGVEDIVSGVALPRHDCVHSARLQLVVLCPELLACVAANPAPAAVLGSLLQPGRVLAMLLGVTDQSVTTQHRAALHCYEDWQRQVVKDQDPMFVGDFLGTAMDILSRSLQLQQAIQQMHKDENKAHFSIIPKKIKVGQNKLMILLVDPLDASDNVHVSIDKNGQKIEVTSFKKRNPYTLQFTVPASCMQMSMLVTVAVEKNGKPLGHRLVKCESRMRELDQLLRSADNPLLFMCQTLGLSPGDKDQLDVFLAAAFQQNIPPHFNLLRATGLRFHSSCEEYPTLLHFSARFGLEKLSWQLLESPGGEQASRVHNGCQLTPADMAERAGHTRLAHTLRSFLQMTELTSMYSYLKGMSEKQANDLMMNMNCTNYLLPRPLNSTYSIPPAARPVLTSPPPPSTPASPSPHSHPHAHQYTNVDCYQVPPSPVSINDNFLYNVPPFPLPLHSPLDNYQVPGQAIPYHPPSPPTPPTPSSPLDTITPGGYMDMQSPYNSNGVGSANKLRRKMSLNLPRHEYHNYPVDPQDHYNCPTAVDDILHCHGLEKVGSHRNSSHSSNSGKSSGVSPQDELVEIINDFKNNVFTISEVEKLVESWQNRHDVQQSFKEKQRQLNEMREEYEKIQRSIKENMKRPTPFERIRKFFSRGKNKSCGGECKKKEPSVSHQYPCVTPSSTSGHRPASSLSLHSSCSSSSGRMSTGSGSSLGDSGTHSDSDERKLSEIAKQDVRTKMLSGRLYTEIPQKDFTKQPDEIDGEKQKLLDCSSSYGIIKPLILQRSNSIQENTIEEESEEVAKNTHEESSVVDKAILEKQEITMVDVHNIPCDNCGSNFSKMEKEPLLSQQLPLPPANPELIQEHTSKKTMCEIDGRGIEKLEIIEDGDGFEEPIKTNGNTNGVDQENNCSEDLEDGDETSKSSTGFVRNLVNFIEHENSFNAFEETDDTCERILEETETEVEFELPDYVNVTSPPIPPRPACENLVT